MIVLLVSHRAVPGKGDDPMSGCIPWAIAAVSTAAFLVLWMWEVKRLLLTQKSMTDSAAAQLSTCRQRAIQDPCDPEAAQILQRSESIYRQAVDYYNRALSRPLICLPGRLLGFRPISTEDKGD